MADPNIKEHILFAQHAFHHGEWDKAIETLGALAGSAPQAAGQIAQLQQLVTDQFAASYYQNTSQHTQLLQEMARHQHRILQLAIHQDWNLTMRTPRYQDPRHLVPHGYKTYSQTDEDGIIAEIFRRIGTTNKKFIEFGTETGIECNTANLLIQGWSGLWLDGSAEYIRAIHEKLHAYCDSGQLRTAEAFITAENINDLFTQNGFTGELDLLSVDIDGNDYWVWQAITAVNPRVVIIEYNSVWRPPVSVVQPYRRNYMWSGKDNYFGASLKALEKLGAQKGYALVGCNYGGGNAFFVRQDLAREDLFLAPFTAEQHYEPSRYFFALNPGHTGNVGTLIEV